MKALELLGCRLARVALLLGVVIATTSTASAGDFRFFGTAVDAYDRPLAGATVRVYMEEGRLPLPVGVVLKTNTVSRPDGTFELSMPAGYGYIVVTKTGAALGWRLWNEFGEPDEIQARIKLTEPASVSGKVVDENGRPEADAEVYVTDAYFERDDGSEIYDYVSASWLRSLMSARSGPGGEFRIKGVPPNCALNLAVIKPGKAFHKKSRGGSVTLHSMDYFGGQNGIKLVTESTGGIEGKASLPNKEKLPAGTLLWLQDQGQNRLVEGQVTQPDGNGSFRFPNVATGAYWVHAAFGTNSVPEWVADSVEAAVLPGDTNDGVEITASMGGVLEVCAVYANDRVPGSDLSLTTFRQSFQSAHSPAPNGIMAVRHSANGCQLEIWRQNTRVLRTNVVVRFDQTNRIELGVEPPARIGGLVTNREGAPVAGMRVFVFPACGTCSQAAAKTDSTGHFTISWDTQAKVGEDSFFLVARDIRKNLAGSIDLTEGTTNYTICVEDGLTISGQVQDVKNRLVTHAVVRLAVWSREGGDWFDTLNPPKLDAQGRFRIPALPRERVYSVRASARGFGQAESKKIEIDTENATHITILPLILPIAEHMISGRVIDESEQPVPWADVIVSGAGQDGRYIRADATGSFQAIELSPGNLLVQAIHKTLRGKARCEAGDTNVIVTVVKPASER